VAHHHRRPYPQPLKRRVDQVGLFGRLPKASARAVAVPEAGPIEDDDPIPSNQPLGDAAGVVVRPGDGVAVQQDDGPPRSSVAVVQPRAIHLEEGALGRVLALRPTCDSVVHQSKHD
jgi:hypothetical protein